MSVFSPGGGATNVVADNQDLTLGGYEILNQTMPISSGTEDSITFSSDTKFFRIVARDNAILKVADSSGQTSTTYVTVTPGQSFEPPQILDLSSSLTLYLESSKGSTPLEIIRWT